MGEKKSADVNKSNGMGCMIALVVIFAIVIFMIITNLVGENIEYEQNAKHEQQLIQEGKVKSHKEVINEIVEILKNKEENKIKEYLADDFIYYDNDNYEHKYLDSFIRDLQIYTTSCDIERRGDTSKNNMATYWIYWNVVEQNKAKGVHKTDTNYCLQRITIYLKRVVKENLITYEIEKIILKNR